MNSQNWAKLLLTFALCAASFAKTPPQKALSSADSACVVKLAGVQFNCPPEWKIVEEIESGTTIGDFDRPDKTGNLTIPPGRASLTVHPMPKIYRNFKKCA